MLLWLMNLDFSAGPSDTSVWTKQADSVNVWIKQSDSVNVWTKQDS
jgi:hypothetical protein